MNHKTWADVDNHYEALLHEDDQLLDSVVENCVKNDLPDIAISEAQGKFLMMLAKTKGAKRILEIGTLGAYSTIWLARALPSDGKLITVEYEQKHANVAKENIQKANLEDKVTVLQGDAKLLLPTLEGEAKQTPFDFTFIDADKPGYSFYFDWAVKLSKSGSVIVSDNVVRDGDVLNQNSDDEKVIGIQEFARQVSQDRRVSSTVIQTVGEKGYDGFMISIVK